MAVIVNPRAGVNAQKNIRQALQRHLDTRRFELSIFETQKAGHATELAQMAVQAGFHIITGVGGDGSLNEIAAGMLHSDSILGIVPAGSGNGLAMHLGYGRNIPAALQKLNQARMQTIDCGSMNGKPFVNIAGIGFDGLVSNLMKGSNWRGFVPYFLRSLEAGLTYTPRYCHIEADGRTITEKCFAIAIANGPMYGYNFLIAPDARLDDGLLEVVILKDAPRWQYFAAVPATLSGKIYDAEFVEHFSAKKIKIISEGENFVHLDGEGYSVEGPMEFEIHPRALRILVPEAGASKHSTQAAKHEQTEK